MCKINWQEIYISYLLIIRHWYFLAFCNRKWINFSYFFRYLKDSLRFISIKRIFFNLKICPWLNFIGYLIENTILM